MYGSSGIYKVIGETGSSFFSFIKACKVYTENAGTDYIQGSIHDREEIFLNMLMKEISCCSMHSA